MTSSGIAGRDAAAGPAVLSIGEVSRRTGIPVAGLRNWEQRYGLPRPQRSPSGQRRYTEADCDLLTEVLRRRAAGLSLSAAMAQATASHGGGRRAVDLRRYPPPAPRPPGARPDQDGPARGDPGDRGRMRGPRPAPGPARLLSASAVLSGVRAALGRPGPHRPAHRGLRRLHAQPPAPRPVAEVAVPGDAPLRQEWTLICDAPDAPACVAAWERPGQDRYPDQDRMFEVLWSVDPAGGPGRGPDRCRAGRRGPPADPGDSHRPGSAQNPRPAQPTCAGPATLIERTIDYLAAAYQTARP